FHLWLYRHRVTVCLCDAHRLRVRAVLAELVHFFLYCAGDHRDLHSFPTRRSSDLLVGSNGNLRLVVDDQTTVVPAEQAVGASARSEEHTSELQSRENLVCRLLLEKKNTYNTHFTINNHPKEDPLSH